MPQLLFLIAGVLFVVSVGLALRLHHTPKDRRRPELAFTALMSAALSVALLASGLVVLRSPADPLKDLLATAAIAAGAVTTTFLLWLGLRRYLLEKARQELDRARLALDRDRMAVERDRLVLDQERADREHGRSVDDMLLKVVELVGSESAQVRCGGLRLLAILVDERPERARQLTDFVCGYLRIAADSADPAAGEAQTVLARIVRTANAAPTPIRDLVLDLRGARLRDFQLNGVTVALLNLSGATLSGVTSLRTVVASPAEAPWTKTGLDISEARFGGDVWLQNGVFAELNGASCAVEGALRLRGTHVRGKCVLDEGLIEGEIDLSNTRIGELRISVSPQNGQPSTGRPSAESTAKARNTRVR